MSLNSADFLTTLINSGADASLNLYGVTFQPLEGYDLSTVKEQFSCRITQMPNLLQRDNTTSEVGFQNVSIPVINTGSSINRTLGFSIRIDENYYIWKKLRELQCIDNFGNIARKLEDTERKINKREVNSTKKVNITISAYKANTTSVSSDNYYEVYEWKFYDCYITSVSPLTYSYDNASTATTSVNFIWKYYEENSIDGTYEAYKSYLNNLGEPPSSSSWRIEKSKQGFIEDSPKFTDNLTWNNNTLNTYGAPVKTKEGMVTKVSLNQFVDPKALQFQKQESLDLSIDTPQEATVDTQINADTIAEEQSKKATTYSKWQAQLSEQRVLDEEAKMKSDAMSKWQKQISTTKINVPTLSTTKEITSSPKSTVTPVVETVSQVSSQSSTSKSSTTGKIVSNPEVVNSIKSTEELLEEKKIIKKQTTTHTSSNGQVHGGTGGSFDNSTTTETPVMETVTQSASTNTKATKEEQAINYLRGLNLFGTNDRSAKELAEGIDEFEAKLDGKSTKTTTTHTSSSGQVHGGTGGSFNTPTTTEETAKKDAPLQNLLLSGLLTGDSLTLRVLEEMKVKKDTSAPAFTVGSNVVTETTTSLTQAVNSGVTDGKELTFALLSDSAETMQNLQKDLAEKEAIAVKYAPKANKPLVNDSATYGITTKINGESPVMSAIKTHISDSGQ